MDEKTSNTFSISSARRVRNGRSELSSRQDGVKLDELDNLLQFGASPRAAISLALAAKGEAFLAGRAYVIPQDVKSLPPMCSATDFCSATKPRRRG